MGWRRGSTGSRLGTRVDGRKNPISPPHYLRAGFLWDRLLARISHHLTRTSRGQRGERGREVERRKVWKRDCMPCHSSGGAPGYAASQTESKRLSAPDSRAAEVGIAREACHGSGGEHAHAAANRNPLRR